MNEIRSLLELAASRLELGLRLMNAQPLLTGTDKDQVELFITDALDAIRQGLKLNFERDSAPPTGENSKR